MLAGSPRVTRMAARVAAWAHSDDAGDLASALGIDRSRKAHHARRRRDDLIRDLAALPPFRDLAPGERAQALARAWRRAARDLPTWLPGDAERLMRELLKIRPSALSAKQISNKIRGNLSA